MLVCRHPFHDRKRARERMVAAVQTSRGPLQRRAKTHGAVGPHLSRHIVGLVEVDDEAAQCVVNRHFNYTQRKSDR